MKIAIVADPYVPIPPPKYGGSELVIHNLINGLLEEGHQPILLAPGDSRVACPLVPTVPRSIFFPAKKADRSDFERKVRTIAQTTEACLRQLVPAVDIIHSHASPASSFDLAEFADFPNVTTLHGPIEFDSIPYFRKRQQLNYVSISDNQREAFRALHYVGTVYNGEDPSGFPIVERPDRYLCFLGRFDREKNPHLAIRLALALNMPIKLAGKIDHMSEGYFEDEIEPFLDHPLVEYLGELGFDEKVELISKASCNLHPTGFREPFGLTVVEAAYCGTPTLAIRRGSMPELIEDGRTGILVEDFIEGYQKMLACLEMDRLYIAKRARTLFNYRTMTKQYLKVYEQVTQDHERRSSKRRYDPFGLPRGNSQLALPGVKTSQSR